MTTQITNKQVKVVSDVNFNNNEIQNAIIDGASNTFLNVMSAGQGIDITNNVISLKGTQQLADGTDLDTIKTEGNYFIKSPTSTLGMPLLPTYTTTSSAGIAYWLCLLLVEKENGFGTSIVRQTITLTPIGSIVSSISAETLMFTRTLCDNYTYKDESWTKIDGDMTIITLSSNLGVVNINNLTANYCYFCDFFDDSFETISSLILTNIQNTPDTIQVVFKAGENFTLTANQLTFLNQPFPTTFENGVVYVITINNLFATINNTGQNTYIKNLLANIDYNNLINKPTIPTVNDATITIQKNSSTIESFTLNQSSNTTINISVPTNVSDLNNDSNFQTGTEVSTSIETHNTSSTAHNDIREDISGIAELIPSQASITNLLADRDFVNSSISTNTANFIGTFANVSALNAYSGTVTNNDYAFVINSVVTDNGNDWSTLTALNTYNKDLLTEFDYAWVINGTNFDLYRFDIINQVWNLRVANTAKNAVTLNTAYNRYKAVVSDSTVTWDYEYTLNNSSFTANQWAAINSGISSNKVTSYDDHLGNTSNPHNVTKSQVGLGNVDNTSDLNKPISTATQNALNLKQDVLTFTYTEATETLEVD